MGDSHILVIPYPAQSHVISLMKLSQSIAKQGFRISFLNTEFNHKRIIDAFGNEKVDENGLIRLVSLPDGLEDGEDRNQLAKLTESLRRVMRRELKEYMEKVIRTEDCKIKCVVADLHMEFELEVAAELGMKRAAFWPASVFQLVVGMSIPKFIDDGLIDQNGTPVNNEHNIFQLSPTLPPISTKILGWLTFRDFKTQEIIFDWVKRYSKAAEYTDWVLCNSCLELEPQGFELAPKLLPIGPLPATNRPRNLSGNFWAEDTSCLQWLDQQPFSSVVYIAFGSFTVFDEIQFRELALGLELSNKPFIWVVRADLTNENHGFYPEGFKERVGNRGKMVGWAPQRAVLSHPSTACFLSHCGWNSTIEGVSNGVPFLCWPYFADQFLNEIYICDVWKIGLKFERDGRGIITKKEIKTKIEKLFGDKIFKERAIQLKEMVSDSVDEGGSSDKVFKTFIEWIKSKTSS